ncbi:MAG TPA: ABC transporter substrate-binding protein [Bradyrhizobium sp.]|nr:ABC transporter substrate-binding protein [Bradyrhizobium sp.]
MKRREFILALGGAAASMPLGARGQPAMPVIGFLSGRSSNESLSASAAFRDALKEAGYIEGQNIAIEYRWAEGQSDQLPTLAADLARRGVAVIFAAGGSEPARAAAAATARIPIVFVSAADPVKAGLVSSLNRPGGNITGVSLIGLELAAKRLGILHQLVPQVGLIGVIFNPQYSGAEVELQGLQAGAAELRQRIQVVNASQEQELERAFATLVQSHAGALLVSTNVFFLSHRARVIALAMQHALPAIYGFREWAQDGGLMSYGPSLSNAYGQAGSYVARILKGDKPADLPVLQPTKFELLINLKTAKALGLEVSPTLQALADEVIE